MNGCLRQLDKIIKSNPDYLPGYDQIVFVYQQKGELDSAEIYFTELLQKINKKAGIYYGMGYYDFYKRNFPKAIDYFKKSIQQKDNIYLPYLKLVDSYKSISKMNEAIFYLDSLYSKSYHNPALLYGLGYVYMVLQNWGKSLVYLDEAIQFDDEFMEAYTLKANVLFNSGDYQEAEKSLQKALDLCENNSHLGDMAIILNNFGTMKFNQGKIYSADYYYQKALDLYKMIGFHESYYTVQMNLGMVKNYIGNFEQALQYLKDCLSYFITEKDSVHLAACLGHIGWVYKNKTEYDSALVYFKTSAVIAEQIADFRFAAYWNRFIGLIDQERGDLIDALEYYHKALIFSQKFNDKAEQARNIAAIGKIFYSIGKVDSSQIYFQKALNINRQAGDKVFEAHTLADMAMVQNHIGNYSQGLKYYETAYNIAKKNNDIASQCRFLENIGASYSHFSDYSSSVEYYNEALRIAQNYKMVSNQMRLLKNIGNIYLYMRKPDSALFYLRKSLVIADRTSSETQKVGILYLMGTAYIIKHNYRNAEIYNSTALEIVKRTNQQIIIPKILLNLGYKNKICNKYKKAKNYYLHALKLAIYMNSVWDIVNIYKRLGELYFAQDSLSLAIFYLEKSINTVEDIRSKISGQEFKISYFESKVDIYNLLIHYLMTLYKRDNDRRHLYDAFVYSERSKSRVMLDLLNQNKDIFSGDISVELLAEQNKAKQRLERIQSELREVIPYLNQKTSRIDSLRNALNQEKNFYKKIRNKVDRLRPVYSTLSEEINVKKLKEIKKRVLQSNQTLLEYTIGDQYSYVFVLQRDSLYIQNIPVTRFSLKKILREINQEFGNINDQFDIGFNLKLAHTLYQQLIQPIEKYISSDETLIIIPDNILYYLPFELLVVRYNRNNNNNKSIWYSTYRDVTFLFEKHPISYSNSISLLDPYLYANKKNAPRDSLLAVGCPFYSENISDNYASSSTEREQYSPIPSSRNEIFNIGSKFEKTHIIYDKQATEERIKRIASQYRFLHFSTHGMLDEQQPLYSGLVLFQDNDKSEDGFLQTYEIFNLNLNAELVTLSACGTGRGIMKKGEGIIGLSRAFQYAGAQSLIVSLWNVSDESTAQLMTYFYQNLKQGMNKVRALQKAKLSLMNTTKRQGDLEISYSHPFFWAPFILIGDTQQIYTSKFQYKQLYWCIFMAGIIGVLIISLKLIKQKRR